MRTLKSIELVFALVVLSASFSACEKEYLLSVENTAGNLESVMGKVKNVSTLKISGPLNGDDIFYLREILTSKSNKGSTLDLSDASIVDGGIAYLGDLNGDGIGNYHTSKDEIGVAMFYNCKFKTIILPKGVTSIGEGAFAVCTSLKEVTIPNSVTSIGWNAFADCTSLKVLAIPDSVTSIGGSTFWYCTNLYTIIIGSGVTTIGNWVFEGCDRLYEFYCYATTPPEISSETFTKGDVFLYVPKGSLEAYETAWGDYFTNISEME